MFRQSDNRARGKNPGKEPWVVLGVDTHQDTHHAALVDAFDSRPIDDREFPATMAGYLDLLDWARSHGRLEKAGVEQTGTYGAGLTTVLHSDGIEVIEVNTVSKADRARHGKTDQLDAYRAATVTATQTQTGKAKHFHPLIDAIRVIMVARHHHVTSRQRAWQRLLALIITSDETLRTSLRGLKAGEKLDKIANWRPNLTRLHDPIQAQKYALKNLAAEVQNHDQATRQFERDLATLVHQTAPQLLAQPQVGPITAARLLITFGHPGRIPDRDKFAKLVGVAPIPVASGKTHRVRLSRSGDRQANSALHMIAIGRLCNDPDTQAYIARTIANGHTKTEAIRSLKRRIANGLYAITNQELNKLDKP